MKLVTNSREFRQQLKAAAKEMDVKFQQVFRDGIMTLFATIVERTPVSPYLDEDPGRLAGSWSISRDHVGSFVVPKGETSSKSAAILRAQRLMFSNPYAIWYIYNLVPYAETVEYGLYPGDGPRTVGGFSTQAPSGMMRISLEEFRLG